MGGGKFLRLLPHATKCRDKIAIPAPVALSFSRPVFAAPTTLFSLLALAIAPLVFATPAYADSISIDLDATAVTLQRSGDLYEHTSSLHVHNSNTYGFTLSMNASQPNLVNSKDSTYKIDSVSGTNQKLAANQWGYGMGKNATTFSSVSSASLADITSDNKGSCTSVDDCTLYLTLGANIDPKRLPVGSYSTSLTYTATSKPAPVQPSTPSSGGSSSGGSSSDPWWPICNDRYSYDSDKRLYCYIHNGDMSGYWNEECHKNYSYDSDKESYCKAHDGDMSGYEIDWNKICSDRYPGSDTSSLNKKSYCIDYKGDMSGYREPESWDKICRSRYPYDSDKESYCEAHNGDMSGYREPEPEPEPEPDWGAICHSRYPGSSGEEGDKWVYCYDHHGDMSGYQTNWNSVCSDRYSNVSDDKYGYCIQHNGDMSGYQSDWRSTCRYYYDDWKRYYCETHYGDMSGYDSDNP